MGRLSATECTYLPTYLPAQVQAKTGRNAPGKACPAPSSRSLRRITPSNGSHKPSHPGASCIIPTKSPSPSPNYTDWSAIPNVYAAQGRNGQGQG